MVLQLEEYRKRREPAPLDLGLDYADDATRASTARRSQRGGPCRADWKRRPEMALELQPVDFNEACEFIRQFHGHHLPPIGWKFGIAVNDGQRVCGVITVGRPVSRMLDNGYTIEATRCCTDGTPHVASKLYAAAWRAARAMGYKRLITYTLKEEAGISLIAAGYRVVYETKGGSWNVPSRPRVDKAPTGPKKLWDVCNGEPTATGKRG